MVLGKFFCQVSCIIQYRVLYYIQYLILHNSFLCIVITETKGLGKGGRRLNIQFKKGVLELCVLALLEDGDYYGYELVKNISSNIKISEGTIYPLLRRLTVEGYFETYLQESTEGPPRKYYRITTQGSEALATLKDEWFDFVHRVSTIVKEDLADE